MAGTSQEKPVTYDALKWLWPFILAIITIASSWGISQAQATYHETRICALESKQEKTQETYSEILTQLAEIQRDLQYLRRDLDRQTAEP